MGLLDGPGALFDQLDEKVFGPTDPNDIADYQAASSNHNMSECGGAWRSHSDPQERLDCIRTGDES